MRSALACFMAVVVASALASCETDPWSHDVHEPGVVLPDMVDGSVPYGAGGAFSVRIEIASSQPVTNGHALLELMPARSDVVSSSVTIPLAYRFDCGTQGVEVDAGVPRVLCGWARPKWPDGGSFRMRVTAFGEDVLQEVVMGSPSVALTGGLGDPGLRREVSLCAQTEAVSGRLMFSFTHMTTAAGADEAELDLQPGGCLGEAGYSSARLVVIVTGEHLEARVEHVGTVPPQRASWTESVDLLEGLMLTLTPPLVLVRGDVATVEARVADAYAGISIDFTSVPELSFIPASAPAIGGAASTSFVVPATGRQFRILATVGDQQASIDLEP